MPTLPRRSGAELQDARRRAAARFESLALATVPEGWTVRLHKRLSGRCFLTEKLIVAPRPVTRRAMHIFLHEVGHAVLHVRPTRKPRHVEELEAEQWAFAKMRELGIAVPANALVRARRYVARKIKQAEGFGRAKHIDPKARAFAKLTTRDVTTLVRAQSKRSGQGDLFG
jgi:hypothetical protein